MLKKTGLKYFLIILPTLSTIIGFGVVVLQKKNINSPTGENIIIAKEGSKSDNLLFPIIESDELYSMIRINDNQPIINNDMIATFIKIVLLKLYPIKGTIATSYKIKSQKEFIVMFIWKTNVTAKETYRIKIS